VYYRCVLKNIDDIVIFACHLGPKYDFNADLYLLQRKIWRDKKNINMTMNGGTVELQIYIDISLDLPV
jgi:N-acetylneuraminic acid mutarotase